MNATTEQKPIRRVLIAFDESEGARAAVEDLRLAGLPAVADVLVLSVAEVPAGPPVFYAYPAGPFEGAGMVPQYALEDAKRAAERETQWAESAAVAGRDLVSGLFPGWKVEAASAFGAAYAAVAEKAREWQADLVVVGSHGRSAVGRLVFGSVSQNVLSHVPCSVRVGRRRDRNGQRPPDASVRVLLAVDGSPDSSAAVAAVRSRRWPSGSKVRVATAVDLRLAFDLALLVRAAERPLRPSPIQALVQSVGERLRDCDLECSTVILEGDPKRALLQEAAQFEADCIFLGARGHSRLERFLVGSVSASVAARADCSVEVVRGGGGIEVP